MNLLVKKCTVFLSAIAGSVFSTSVFALPYYYTDWTSWNPGGGTAQGVITLPDASTVTVNFDAIRSDGTAGSFMGVAGSSLWSPTTAYTSAQVSNASPFEAIQLVGENNMTYRVTLSAPIKDPLMDVTTLGSLGVPATYVFDAPFTILSQGPTCCWGSGTLTQLAPPSLKAGKGRARFSSMELTPRFRGPCRTVNTGTRLPLVFARLLR